MVLLHRSPLILRNNYNFFQRFSSFSNRNVRITEIKFPYNSTGHIAGKLWESPQDPNSKICPPILCLHGWVDNCGSFDRILPYLMGQPNRQILAIDYPGHGLSSHTQQTHYDMCLESFFLIHKILKLYSWEKVILFGHSLGSVISFIFSGLFPEKVCGYIGLDFLGPNPPKDFINFQRRAIQNLLDLDEKSLKKEATYYTYDEILDRLYQGRGQQISIEGCKTLLTRGSIESKENPGKFKWSYDVKSSGSIVWGLYRDQMVHDLARRITCPTCYIKFMPGLGDGHEPFEQTIRIGQIIKTYNPNYNQVSVEGGHHAHLDVPEKIEPIVNEFLLKYYS